MAAWEKCDCANWQAGAARLGLGTGKNGQPMYGMQAGHLS